MNCDACLVANTLGLGLDCCIRDCYGSLICVSSMFSDFSSSILLAELRAIALGFVLAVNHIFCRIMMESD